MREPGLFRSGAHLVRRHARLVWWIFFVGLVLAWLGSLPARSAFSRMLNHSLVSEKLVSQFDVPTFAELLAQPEITTGVYVTASVGMALVFFVYMLFINGGVVSVYLEDRKLSKSEFFEQSGGFFWRMVRLLIVSLIPFGILAGLFSAVRALSNAYEDKSGNGPVAFAILVAGVIVLGLSALWVRAWFDLAQVRTVAQNERGMIRTALQTFTMVPARLWGTYIATRIVMGVCIILGILVWRALPHRATIAAFVVLEALMLVQIVQRLWQKAAAANWYARYGALPVVSPTPTTVEVEPPLAIQPPAQA